MPRKSDATELLKQDHREIEDLFERIEETDDDQERQDLAIELVEALRLHIDVKTDIFYPAVRDALKKPAMIDDATVLLDTADYLLTLIEDEPEDPLLEARLRVLKQMVIDHFEEEEDQLFKKLRGDVDMEVLGERIAQRKSDLMTEEDDEDEEDEEDAEELDGELPLDADYDEEDEDERMR